MDIACPVFSEGVASHYVVFVPPPQDSFSLVHFHSEGELPCQESPRMHAGSTRKSGGAASSAKPKRKTQEPDFDDMEVRKEREREVEDEEKRERS